MAKFVLKNGAVRVNSVLLSDHCKSVAVESKYTTVDTTGMGDTAVVRALGLSDDAITVEFYQDFTSSSVDQTLWPLYSGGSTFLVEVWAAGTATSATNPKYSASCVMENYSPISGGASEAAMTSVTFSAQAAIARATS